MYLGSEEKCGAILRTGGSRGQLCWNRADSHKPGFCWRHMHHNFRPVQEEDREWYTQYHNKLFPLYFGEGNEKWCKLPHELTEEQRRKGFRRMLKHERFIIPLSKMEEEKNRE